MSYMGGELREFINYDVWHITVGLSDLGGWPRRSWWIIKVWHIKTNDIIMLTIMARSSDLGGWPRRSLWNIKTLLWHIKTNDIIMGTIIARSSDLGGHYEISISDMTWHEWHEYHEKHHVCVFWPQRPTSEDSYMKIILTLEGFDAKVVFIYWFLIPLKGTLDILEGKGCLLI